MGVRGPWSGSNSKKRKNVVWDNAPQERRDPVHGKKR